MEQTSNISGFSFLKDSESGFDFIDSNNYRKVKFIAINAYL